MTWLRAGGRSPRVQRLSCALVCVVVAAAGGASPARGQKTGLTDIDVGGGFVWTTDTGGGVSQIEPETGELVRNLRVGDYAWDVSATEDAVWVGADAGLLRIDPARSGATTARGIGAGVTAVAARGDVVWAVASGSEREIHMVDPRTVRVVATVEAGGRVARLASGPSGAWAEVVTGRGAITGPRGPRLIARLDAARTAVGRPSFPRRCDSPFAVGRGELWVADACAGTVSRVRTRGRRGLVDPVAVGAEPSSVALGHGSVWVASAVDGTVTRISRATGAVQARIAAGSPRVLATAGNRVWVGSADGEVSAIDPLTNAVGSGPLAIPRAQPRAPETPAPRPRGARDGDDDGLLLGALAAAVAVVLGGAAWVAVRRRPGGPR